jgi:hypothetical protein
MSSISVENLIAEEFICFVVTGYVSTYLVFFFQRTRRACQCSPCDERAWLPILARHGWLFRLEERVGCIWRGL